MTTDYSDWISEVQEKISRFKLIFLQVGASNEPARRSILASGAEFRTVQSYLDEGAGIDCGTLIIDQMEHLTRRNESSKMGRLREQIFADLGVGIGIILLSRSPRVAFPDVVGSSLLDDASFVHAPAKSFNSVHEWPTCSEDEIDAEQVLLNTVVELGAQVHGSLDRAVYELQLKDSEALSILNARELELWMEPASPRRRVKFVPGIFRGTLVH